MKYRITAIALGIIFLVFSLLMLAVKDQPAPQLYDDVIKLTDDEGKEIFREYVDSKGKPVTLPAGYSAYSLEYDSKGRAYKVTYLDKEKKPVKISSGCSYPLEHFSTTGQALQGSVHSNPCIHTYRADSACSRNRPVRDRRCYQQRTWWDLGHTILHALQQVRLNERVGTEEPSHCSNPSVPEFIFILDN